MAPLVRNLMDMVASLQPALKLDMLYENPFVCEAILRCLPPLAKKYVLQLLYIDGPVTTNSFDEWVLPDGVSSHKLAVDRLIQLRILTEITVVGRKKEATYLLNSTFQRNLQKHIVHGICGVLPMPSSNITGAVRLPSLEELDAYAVKQWENFLINSDLAKNFEFLLMDANAQLWYVIGEYITIFQSEHGVDAAGDLISFLVELGFRVTGEAYTFNTLSDIQQNILKDIAGFGLVKLQQSWFIPTDLATNLSVHTSSRKEEGFVLVETNFRIYSYSTSKLHLEILRLFSEIEYLLPNLIVCAMTEESLRRAFLNGITAEHIISFLEQNAHPRSPCVPENVYRIRLWEDWR